MGQLVAAMASTTGHETAAHQQAGVSKVARLLLADSGHHFLVLERRANQAIAPAITPAIDHRPNESGKYAFAQTHASEVGCWHLTARSKSGTPAPTKIPPRVARNSRGLLFIYEA